MSYLSEPHFHDEEEAYEWVEARVWPNGAECPKCGERERVSKMKGKSTRIGVYKCYKCRKPFTVKVGTIFESSHIKMHIWLQAIYLMSSSKKGISSNQLHRTLGITLKSAWFLSHRIREAMRCGGLATPMGGDGGMVEADETFIGHDKTKKPKGVKKGRGFHHKHKVLTLVERNSGQARSVVVDNLKATTIGPIVSENLDKEARLMTDEASYYTKIGKDFVDHQIVSHNRGEYGRGEFHTNTVEGYFSIFKRGMKGVYQHCGEKHLHRYLAEYDFRYNNRVKLGVDDKERAERVLKGVRGKRLTYETAHSEKVNAQTEAGKQAD